MTQATATATPTTLRERATMFPRAGRIEAILLRPARLAPVQSVHEAQALVDRGLQGDRSAARTPSRAGGGKRQVTLIQAEHLPVIAALCGHDAVQAADLLIPNRQQERPVGNETEALLDGSDRSDADANRSRRRRFGSFFVHFDDSFVLDLRDEQIFLLANAAEIGFAPLESDGHSHGFQRVVQFARIIHLEARDFHIARRVAETLHPLLPFLITQNFQQVVQ